jgi:hypothetical protein
MNPNPPRLARATPRASAGDGILCIAVLAALLLAPSIARAQQDVRNTGFPGTDVQLALIGNVSSAIQLSIVGSGNTVISNATSTLPGTPAVGTVDFGAFSTLRPYTAKGDAYRILGVNPGAVIAARLIATLTFHGTPTASISVARQLPAGPAPDVPLAHLRLSSPPIAWSAPTQGSMVPDANTQGTDICIAAGATTCGSGVPYEHHIAIFLPDTQPAGNFSTVVVYTAVAP